MSSSGSSSELEVDSVKVEASLLTWLEEPKAVKGLTAGDQALETHEQAKRTHKASKRARKCVFDVAMLLKLYSK